MKQREREKETEGIETQKDIPGMLGDIIENQAPTRVALKM